LVKGEVVDRMTQLFKRKEPKVDGAPWAAVWEVVPTQSLPPTPPIVQTVDEETVLQEAERLVGGERQVAYGHPRDNFTCIAGMLSALFARKLRAPFVAEDVPLIFFCVKAARLETTPGHRESLVDMAGYARAYERLGEPAPRQAVEHE
jgi:hypothetical protein